MTTIDLTEVSLRYGIAEYAAPALRDVTLSVRSGEAVALIGPSGCGKSTVLKLIAGLLHPSAGMVALNGACVERPRAETALILQDYGLLPWKTALDNAALGLRLAGGLPTREARRQARAALERVGLGEVAGRYPAELSGGMKQRVAIARSLALDADVVLMDEPFSALDALTREELQDVLLDLWAVRGHTQVLVTHSIEEAVYLGQRIVIMAGHPGTVRCIIENPGVGTPAWRDDAAYHRRCTEVRAALESEVGADAAERERNDNAAA